MEVYFVKSKLPIAACVVAEKNGLDVNFIVDKKATHETTSRLKDGSTSIRGNLTIARFFASKSQTITTDIDQWLEFAAAELSSPEQIDLSCQRLNWMLQLRTVLSGYEISLADLAVYEALKTNSAWMGYAKQFGSKLPHLMRWFGFIDSQDYIQEQFKLLMLAVKKNNSTKDQKQNEDTKKNAQLEVGEGSFEIDLPGVKIGEVCTRFPPEPSGYLHIGHAKAALMNDYFARRYKGKLVFRFDDTNPAKEKSEFEHAILEDVSSLGIKYDVLTYTSDSFPIIEKYAEQMIRDGKAYVDNTPKELLQKMRGDGIESASRSNSVEENLRLWEEMKNGTELGQQCCLRAKIDMQANNKTLRDPILYRCVLKDHPRTGNKYKCYPTYDFACPIVDSIEGITHALRTTEYHDRNEQYYWMIDALKIRKPNIWDFGRLNFVRTVMSKRKLQWFVDTGKVEGWNDPRFPTVQGLLRRGLTIEALRQFVLSQGASKSINWLQWEKLWSFNKKIIDPIVPRYTALNKKNIVVLHLADGPAELETRELPKHKKNASVGTKPVAFFRDIYIDAADAAVIKEGEEVTLMDWGNAIVTKINKDDAGVVTSMEGKLNLAGSVKTTRLKLTWLAVQENCCPVTVVHFDHLITKDKLEENDNIEELITPNSRVESESIGDPILRTLKKGDMMQLERRGYFICDQALEGDKPLVLHNIPA